jgi:hypothetical protein
MKSTIQAALQPTLVLSTVLMTGCITTDDDDNDSASDMEEDVAAAESALTDSMGIGQFFLDRQNKPALSVGRGAGAVPSVCPSGYELILGGCWSWSGVIGASCPSHQEMDGGLCYDLCPLGYDGVGPVCWLGSIDVAVCDALYSPVLAASAQSAHRARTYGIGAGIAVGASVSVETGVYYGESGQYGCYTSVCSGVVTDVSVEISASFGDFTGVAALTGDGFDLSVGAGYGVAGYTQSLSFDGSGNVVGFVQQTSLGAGLSPIALGVSSCDTTLLQRSGPITLTPADAPDPRPGNTFYRVASDGTLQMSHHRGDGTFDMVNQTIGWGWSAASKVFAAEGGHVYAIMPDGDLRYYHHDSAGNWDNWGTVIGTDWHVFAKVFAGRFGEIYAIWPNGDLWLYKHNSALQFSAPSAIGTQWNVPVVFTGGHGALYIVDGNGDLRYYYHDENNTWIHQNMKIGTGWNVFATLGSTGNGEIYGVTPAGALRFYRHDVDKVWQAGSGGQIGSGWDFGSAGLIPAAY